MKKVILNKCYGGFQVSPEGYRLYAKKKGLQIYAYSLCLNNYKNYDYTEKPNLGTYWFTKSFGTGKNIEISDSDYENYILYLCESHREDKILVEIVEELGDKVNTFASKLVVVEIPDDLDYVIDEYDGVETLHQKVQEW